MSVSNIVDEAVFVESNVLMGQIIVARVELAEPESEDSLKSSIRVACKASPAACRVPVKVFHPTDALVSARHQNSRKASDRTDLLLTT